MTATIVNNTEFMYSYGGMNHEQYKMINDRSEHIPIIPAQIIFSTKKKVVSPAINKASATKSASLDLGLFLKLGIQSLSWLMIVLFCFLSGLGLKSIPFSYAIRAG